MRRRSAMPNAIFVSNTMVIRVEDTELGIELLPEPGLKVAPEPGSPRGKVSVLVARCRGKVSGKVSVLRVSWQGVGS